MKVIDRIELLEKIGLELQSRMTFDEIDMFFAAHGIDCKDIQPSANSKRIYAKEVLAQKPEDLIFKIAEELNVPHGYSTISTKEATFWKAGYFRLFLSHLASFKVQTSHLQSVLSNYAISAFVAHEDIEPSKEWQLEIEAGLHSMDALAAILMNGFKESNWCDQEVGVAVGRGVLIIPVRRGLDPYGFIGKYQGIQALNKTVGEVAEQIFLTIVKSPKTREKMLNSLVNAIAQSTDIEEAINRVNILKSLESVPEETLESLKARVSDNSILIESQGFLSVANVLLSKFGVQRILPQAQVQQEEWDDIPF
ncbi:TIR domain-containing protein [Shewanella sp. JBTF-M18]|uniref:TIR domain-containing protein n=1 Tax=Shewanella insulae TaxID=2681496 RepID=A0A6L7HWF3_9GAMM|nr:toll/interleukin-1 receptor domain-containing protein [Shewanella insulae]MXR68646.1 TIR domain-containing protein [Shewanella insulae]